LDSRKCYEYIKEKFGTLTAGLGFGGYLDPGNTNVTEKYDGTSWTTSGNLLIPLSGSSGSGIQTAALQMGGSPATGFSSQFDGTSWITTATMTEGRAAGSGSPSGTSTAALQTNGSIQTGPTSHPAATEEFTGETITQVAKTLSSS
jgi:hypothetical protein